MKTAEYVLRIAGPNGTTINRFATFKKGYQSYLDHCADKDCDNMEQPVDQETAMDLSAGGRGYDYTITLTEESED